MEIIRKTAKYVILIGLIGYVLITFFGENATTFLKSNAVNGIEFYYIDVIAYKDALQKSVGQLTELTIDQPTRQWTSINASWDIPQMWDALVNNLQVILNWIIFGLNCLVYPIRIGCYFLKQILVIVGLNFESQHGLTWLLNIIKFFIEDLQLGYI